MSVATANEVVVEMKSFGRRVQVGRGGKGCQKELRDRTPRAEVVDVK